MSSTEALDMSISESTPESKFWGAYLLYLLKDMIPEYVTSSYNPPKLVCTSKESLDSITSTYIFELACHATGYAPSYVKNKLHKIRSMVPTEAQIIQHNKRYPNGGRSALMTVSMSHNDKNEYYF